MISTKTLKVKFEYAPYLSRDGSFFRYNIDSQSSKGSCHSCRESFEYESANDWKFIGFHGRNLNIKQLNEFFEQIERRIGLKEKTKFYFTDKIYTVIVEPAHFWLKSAFYRGLLTLFLRCGGGYYTGDFEKALSSYRLTSDAKPAIHRFLRGNTKFNRKVGSGEVADLLAELNPSEINKCLIGGKNSGYESYMLDMNPLEMT